MNKRNPKVNEIWLDRDNNRCVIVKVIKNKINGTDLAEDTYRIIENSFGTGFNIMEASRNDFIKYVGETMVGDIHNIFEVTNEL